MQLTLPKTTPDRWRLLGIIALIQAVLWVLVLPRFGADYDAVDYQEISRIEMAQVADPSWQTVQQADYETIDIPYSDCCETGYRAMRITFPMEAIPDGGLGLIHELDVDTFETRVNGSLIYDDGSLELDSLGLEGRGNRSLLRLPSGLLRIGSNDITFTIAQKEGSLRIHAAEPLLGDYSALKQTFGHRLFLLNEYKYISITIGYLVAVLAYLAWLRGGRQPYLFWLGSLAALWAFGLHQQKWTSMPVPAEWRALISGVVLLALPFMWVQTINAWGARRFRHVGKVVAALVPLLTGLTIAAYLYERHMGAGFIPAEVVAFIATALGALGFAIILLAKLPKIERELHWEFAIFFACMVILLREMIDRIFGFGWVNVVDYVLPLLLAALAAAFLSRNIKLFKSAAQINTMLQGQLETRTAELAVVHNREKMLLRDQAHQEERQRIMRDMHDGLGSNLMSMLLSAKRGIADPPVVADGLQAAIDEMRLLIDSMDMVGESLAAAFSLFRQRADSRVVATGFKFVWADHAGSNLPDMSPHSVLQIFRILQEALTNALKHSTGDTITIDVYPDRITLSDNGDKLGEPRRGGHGLDNMKARTRSIGATFEIAREDGLTVVTVIFPSRDSAPARGA